MLFWRDHHLYGHRRRQHSWPSRFSLFFHDYPFCSIACLSPPFRIRYLRHPVLVGLRREGYSLRRWLQCNRDGHVRYIAGCFFLASLRYLGQADNVTLAYVAVAVVVAVSFDNHIDDPVVILLYCNHLSSPFALLFLSTPLDSSYRLGTVIGSLVVGSGCPPLLIIPILRLRNR